MLKFHVIGFDTSAQPEILVDRARFPGSARRQCHDVSIGAEFEICIGEFLVGIFRLKENNHAIELSTKLWAKAALQHLGGSNFFVDPFGVLDADFAITHGTTDEEEANFPDLFENGVSVGALKIGLAFFLFCEVFHGECRSVECFGLCVVGFQMVFEIICNAHDCFFYSTFETASTALLPGIEKGSVPEPRFEF